MKPENNIILIEPSETYEKDYLSYLRELDELNEEPVPFILKFKENNFCDLIKKIKNFSKGIGIPEGFVAHSTYWLLNANKIIGVANIRHKLTEKLKYNGGIIGYGIRPSERKKGYGTILLKLALMKANEMNIDNILITCNKSNIPSSKIIIKNGGEFDSEEIIDNEIMQRFWIKNIYCE